MSTFAENLTSHPDTWPPEIAAAVDGIKKRLRWPSLHWGAESLHDDALPHIAAAALDAVQVDRAQTRRLRPGFYEVPPEVLLDAVRHRLADPDKTTRIRGLELLENYWHDLAPWDQKRIAAEVRSADWWVDDTAGRTISLAERTLRDWFPAPEAQS